MIDTGGCVLKTLNDHYEEREIQFIQLEMKEGHPWIDREMKEVELPPDTLLMTILRGKEALISEGSTGTELNDMVVLSANACEDDSMICLTEITTDKSREWCDKQVSELELSEDTLIIMIRRGGQAMISDGMAGIREGDELAVNENRRVGAVQRDERKTFPGKKYGVPYIGRPNEIL